ncbi:hypothetical protein ACTWP5_11385 [Streptomyces sp. 4N509B]|uniref:hypothetical protein n=1 Tax=Streptomyces sp. 4N509B TaxID=3457413 RepID=UPI003FD1E2A2
MDDQPRAVTGTVKAKAGDRARAGAGAGTRERIARDAPESEVLARLAFLQRAAGNAALVRHLRAPAGPPGQGSGQGSGQRSGNEAA